MFISHPEQNKIVPQGNIIFADTFKYEIIKLPYSVTGYYNCSRRCGIQE
jgi:hypothetical protein